MDPGQEGLQPEKNYRKYQKYLLPEMQVQKIRDVLRDATKNTALRTV